MPVDTNSLTCDSDAVTNVVAEMRKLFGNKSADYYYDYAWALCMLSDPIAIQAAAAELNSVMAGCLNTYLRDTYNLTGTADAQTLVTSVRDNIIVCDGKEFRKMVASGKTVADGVQDGIAKVSVNKLLKACFRQLSVQGLLLDSQSAVFSDSASRNFVPFVRLGGLFVDGVTAGHGEFTHTIQWLLIAAAKKVGKIQLKTEIGELYSRAVDIITTQKMMFEKPGVDTPFEERTMWDLVVDCFLTTKEQEKDPRANIAPKPRPAVIIQLYELGDSLFARNFRAPRMLQYALLSVNPESGSRFGHANTFLYQVEFSQHAPLLCALLQNRHKNKDLKIDMDEGKFQKFYSDDAVEKAEKTVEKLNTANPKAKKRTVKEFLEYTKKDRATFLPPELTKK